MCSQISSRPVPVSSGSRSPWEQPLAQKAARQSKMASRSQWHFLNSRWALQEILWMESLKTVVWYCLEVHVQMCLSCHPAKYCCSLCLSPCASVTLCLSPSVILCACFFSVTLRAPLTDVTLSLTLRLCHTACILADVILCACSLSVTLRLFTDVTLTVCLSQSRRTAPRSSIARASRSPNASSKSGGSLRWCLKPIGLS